MSKFGYLKTLINTKLSLLDDFKKYGYWETLKKLFILREVWWEKQNKVLVGVDKLGNKYWETTEPTELHRNRWVELARKDIIYDASDVPAEWHMWLHRVRDEPPSEDEINRTMFAVKGKHHPNYTGDPLKRYYPPGHFFNPNHVDVSTIDYGRNPEEKIKEELKKYQEQK
ncbi:hypothetical protein ABK040_000128 [Willaertia magna]